MPSSLILASTSPYRRVLLDRLRVPFAVQAPGCDETPKPGEEPRELAARLARTKARSVAMRFPDALVLGADQVAVCRDRIVGKPGNAARSIEQLGNASGQAVRFFTAVCLVRDRDGRLDEHVDLTTVHFRQLEEAEIARYVALEKPFDSAGAFKSEGLGIALFERIDSQDPTALIGLPLLWVAKALRAVGMNVP